jgi:hypothetical protein
VAACSLLQVLHHGSFTSSSDARRMSSPLTRTPSGQSSSSFDRRRQRTISHVRFILSNHILHIEYVDLRRHEFVS